MERTPERVLHEVLIAAGNIAQRSLAQANSPQDKLVTLAGLQAVILMQQGLAEVIAAQTRALVKQRG